MWPGLGQLASVTDPLGDQKLYGYNLAGDLTSVGETGPSKPTNTTTYTYDQRHALTAVTDSLGHQSTLGYDAAGNQVSVTDPLGHAVTYGYDVLNRVSSVTDALNHASTYGYDAVGNRTSVTDPLGRATTYSYDWQGRVLTATDPLAGVTSYGYDLMGRVTSLTDPDRNTTNYAYDTNWHLTSVTDPLGHATTYAYNVLGQVTSTTDRDGRQRTFAYDANGRETSETWLNGLGQAIYTATYTYDAIGELSNASDPYSSYAYGYDAADRLTSVDNAGTPGVPHVVLSYGYDVYNNRTSLTDSLGGSVSYSYDAAHRLTGLALTVGSATANVTMGYDNADRLTGLTRTAGAGSDTIASSFTYDNADRLTTITHTDATKSVTLASYTYGYDNANQLTSYQDTNSSLTYGYDRDGQLTSVSGTLNGSSYSASYSYDANGNRNMTGYSTGTGNELTSDGTYNYTYDNEGNLLTQTTIATGYVTYYTWDYRNRLTEVKQEDNHGNVLNDEKFTYDVFNNRIGVMLNGTQQLYTVYDGANPYIDFNGSGTLTQRYLTSPFGLNQFYAQMSAGGTTQWLLTDNLDSVRQVVDTSGNLLDRITYDAYGQIVAQTNSANAPRFGYAGGAYDPITGYVQFYARPYGPADGRFMSQDPLGVGAGDMNGYRYGFNAPTVYTDPTGYYSYPYGYWYVPKSWPKHPTVGRKVYLSGYILESQLLRTPGGQKAIQDEIKDITKSLQDFGKVIDDKIWHVQGESNHIQRLIKSEEISLKQRLSPAERKLHENEKDRLNNALGQANEDLKALQAWKPQIKAEQERWIRFAKEVERILKTPVVYFTPVEVEHPSSTTELSRVDPVTQQMQTMAASREFRRQKEMAQLQLQFYLMLNGWPPDVAKIYADAILGSKQKR